MRPLCCRAFHRCHLSRVHRVCGLYHLPRLDVLRRIFLTRLLHVRGLGIRGGP